MGNRSSYPGGEAAGTWSWPLTSIYCRGQRMHGATPPAPIRLHTVVLRWAQGQIYLFYETNSIWECGMWIFHVCINQLSSKVNKWISFLILKLGYSTSLIGYENYPLQTTISQLHSHPHIVLHKYSFEYYISNSFSLIGDYKGNTLY